MRCEWFVLPILLLSFACAAPEGEGKSPLLSLIREEPPVFPLMPELPRVQYLFSFRSSVDVVAEKPSDSLTDFLVGKVEEDPMDIIVRAYGIAGHGNKLYVCDVLGGCLWIVDPVDQTFERFTSSGQGQIFKPITLDIDSAGEKYIVDLGRRSVLRFDAQNRFVAAYGREELKKPIDVARVGEELFVVDIADHEIEVYDRKTGSYKRTLGEQGNDPGQFSNPSGITSDKDGNLYVSDHYNWRVQKVDTNGKHLQSIGSSGETAGGLSVPKGLDVGPDGILYVVDARYHFVQMFNPKGEALMVFGGGGHEAGKLVLPADVSILTPVPPFMQQFVHPSLKAKALALVTSQGSVNQVSVYALVDLKEGHEAPLTPQAETAPADPAALPEVPTGGEMPVDVELETGAGE